MVEDLSGVQGMDAPDDPIFEAMAALAFYVTCLFEDLALELGLELVLPL